MRRNLSNYLSAAKLACYDGEPVVVADLPATDLPAADPPAADPIAKPAGFTQEQVNAFMAKDRLKNEAAHKAAQKTLLQQQESQYNALLASKSLTEQERDQLNEALACVQKQLLSEKEFAARELKKTQEVLSAKVNAAEQQVADWKGRFQESTIKRELTDAAAKNDACDPSQLVKLLRGDAKLVPLGDTGEFQVVVDFEDVVDGKPVVSQMAPTAAMKRMRELPQHGNLFKSSVVSGVGGDSNTAGQPAGDTGLIDYVAMAKNPAAYMELRKKSPQVVYGR
jgi:hypothetical protein